MWRGGVPGTAICSWSSSTARAPISCAGTSAAVSGGWKNSAQCCATTPVMEKSRGTTIPCRARARSMPGRIASLMVAIEVTSGCWARSLSMHASPAMNIKTVALSEEGAIFGQMVLPLTREQVAKARAEGGDGKVTVGFRPEECELVSATEGGMPIVVDLVEDLGSGANVYGHAAINGDSERFVVATDRRTMPNLGDTVFVKPRTDHHHAFHATTGERI
jgi:MalK-like protein